MGKSDSPRRPISLASRAPHEPMYHQVSRDLLSRIDSGEFTQLGQLPSYSQLCREYRVSEITARRAITTLRENGRVYTEKGRGIFVREAARYRVRLMQPQAFNPAAGSQDPVAFVLFDLYDGIVQKAQSLGAEVVRYSRIGRLDRGDYPSKQISAAPAEGWIFLHEYGFEAELAEVVGRDLPYVVVEAFSPQHNRVTIDIEAGCYEMTRYLRSQGHERIAFLTRPDTNPWYTPRHHGYRRAMQETHGTLDPDLIGVVECYDPIESDTIVGRWLRMPAPERPTAIFAANDLMAMHVLDYLRLRQVRVPEDMSIVGYDNAPEASEAEPPLTTVDAPRREAGAEAVVQLIRLIEGQQRTIEKILQPQLVLRDSVLKL